MNDEKQEDVSFLSQRKESFKERLKQLIGNRSVRAAARDWGFSFSTLNNYLTKNTDPALSNVQAIANKEQVSLDWLVYGTEKPARQPTDQPERAVAAVDDLKRDWLRIYDRMTLEQREAVLSHIALNGIRAILPGGAENSASNGLNDSELIEIEDNLLRHGVNRTTAKVIMMALNLPSEEVREIFEAAAASARLKSSQASAIRGQEKKA
ncbi:helix-turn-helix domain-containing protein [Serratia fonticola]|uniref:helix-turn-helix domain-containing protein n=1 Tax=Serratia fonticola TaxID=47917 RepID=UPI0027F8714D|nr:helix-turn-helix domain-containing protein [Serratia fonticola]MDQ7211446.1 transcriptional regulator [Serratia fonticola]HBE9093522.1 transcriptional regulator [Serratia fonticola]HBE9155810.1 transcriptional regulator [Serratia fonticola]